MFPSRVHPHTLWALALTDLDLALLELISVLLIVNAV